MKRFRETEQMKGENDEDSNEMVVRNHNLQRRQQENKSLEENNKSKTNKASFTALIISPFHFLSFCSFCVSFCCRLFAVITIKGIKSFYGNKQGKVTVSRACHPHRGGGIQMFFSRTSIKEETWRQAEEQR